MSWVTAPAGVVGGLGLVLVGATLAAEAARIASGRPLRRLAQHASLGGGRAYGLGAATALAPASAAQSQSIVALASGGLLPLGSALQAGVASILATVVTAWVIALSAARPAFFFLALLLLGVASVVRFLGRDRSAGPWARVVIGWCVLAIGAHVLAEGMRQAGTSLRLDALALGIAPRTLIYFAGALAATAFFRTAAPLMAVAICGAVSGALDTTTSAGVLCGAMAGSGGAAWLALPSEHGIGKKAALGVGVGTLAAGLLGLFVLALCLPLLVAAQGEGNDAAMRLAGYVTALAVVVIGVYAPLHDHARRILDELFVAEDGEGAESLEIPELLVAGLEHRHSRAAQVARTLARSVLCGEGVTQFRLEQDRVEVLGLAREVEGLWARATSASFPADVGARLAAAVRSVRALPRLVADLYVLRTEIAQQEPYLTEDLRAALRHHQVLVLQLFEAATLPHVVERIEALYEDQALIESGLGQVERYLYSSTASGALTPDFAVALGWRVGRLRMLARSAVEVGEATLGAEFLPERASWRRLGRWLGASVRTIRARNTEPVEDRAA